MKELSCNLEEGSTSVNDDSMHIKDNLLQKFRNKLSKVEICANDDPANTVVNILSSISYPITPEDMQDCHRLSSKTNKKPL